jgi:hypothetical protein
MEKQNAMGPLLAAITIITIGLGSYFGAALYRDMDYVIAGGPIEGIDAWTIFVGNWLIVVGAFGFMLALLGRLLAKKRKKSHISDTPNLS